MFDGVVQVCVCLMAWHRCAYVCVLDSVVQVCVCVFLMA